MKYSVTVFLFLCFLSASFSQSRDSWPMINGDAMHSSYTTMELNFPLSVVDTLTIPHRRASGVAIWEDVLFLMDYAADSNRMVVANLSTGDTLWTFAVPESGGGVSYIPAVSDGVVLVGGQGGRGLYAKDAFTGDSLWFLDVGSMYGRCPVISDSMVYLPAGPGLQCLNLYSGELYWSFGSFVLRGLSPVVDEENVYCGQNELVYAADKITGDTVWTNDSVNIGLFAALALDDQYLYLSYSHDVYALDKSTGSIVWSITLDTNEVVLDFPGPFAITPDYLLVKYFIDGNTENQFMVLDKKTGQEINRYSGGTKTFGTPTIINQSVLDYLNFELKVFDLVTGDQIYHHTGIPVFNYPTQIITDGQRIYITGNGPNVAVLEGTVSSTSDPSYLQLTSTVFPNPSEDIVHLSFSLKDPSSVSVSVYSSGGNLIKTQFDGRLPIGEHELSVPIKDLPPSSYIIRLETNDGVAVHQFVKIE